MEQQHPTMRGPEIRCVMQLARAERIDIPKFDLPLFAADYVSAARSIENNDLVKIMPMKAKRTDNMARLEALDFNRRNRRASSRSERKKPWPKSGRVHRLSVVTY